MGKINLITKSQRIAFIDRNGYVARPDRYSKISADNVISGEHRGKIRIKPSAKQ